MTVYKRPDLNKLIQQAAGGETASLYLFTGERSLCLEAVDKLLACLFAEPDEQNQGLRRISGDQEDLKEIIGLLRTVAMFSSRTVVLVDDSRLFKSKKVADKVWERTMEAYKSGDEKWARMAILNFLAIGGVKPQEIDALSADGWQEAFGFARPEPAILDDMARIVAGADLPKPVAGEEELAAWVEAGGPGGNILILITPELDRRKALYKALSKKAAVVDLKVDQGTGRLAQESRAEIIQEVIRKTLAVINKRLAPGAEKLLVNRVGFHPEAIRFELEKLAMFDPDAPEINLETVRNEVPLTSEHAIFELTEAFFAPRLFAALLILQSLLENGMHPLAVIAGLRNQGRKLLAARELACGTTAREIGFSVGMSFSAFQKNCLPRIKDTGMAPEVIRSHPFVVYKTISRAAKIPGPRLLAVMEALMECEMRLKGSGIAGHTLLFAMIFKLLRPIPIAAAG